MRRNEAVRNVRHDLPKTPENTSASTRQPDRAEAERNQLQISPASCPISTINAEEKQTRHDPRPLIDIVYADAAIVVVHKPAGLTTMRHAYEEAEFGERGRRYLPKTLADYLPGLLGTPRRKVYAVHRLDRDTSGLVVFARTPQAAQALAEQLRRHRIDRRYWAITRGVPTEGRLESWLVRDRGDGRRGSAPADVAGAKHAVTYVRVIERLGPFALVECRLETGRTHQVRIHLGEAGTPLCGERIYDRPLHGKPYPDDSGAARPMLHARTLGFVHPLTEEHLLWEAPPPADFLELLERLRRRKMGRNGGESC
jgi:23S rRNA pseudouridine1911/1915/1917 synthase